MRARLVLSLTLVASLLFGCGGRAVTEEVGRAADPTPAPGGEAGRYDPNRTYDDSVIARALAEAGGEARVLGAVEHVRATDGAVVVTAIARRCERDADADRCVVERALLVPRGASRELVVEARAPLEIDRVDADVRVAPGRDVDGDGRPELVYLYEFARGDDEYGGERCLGIGVEDAARFEMQGGFGTCIPYEPGSSRPHFDYEHRDVNGDGRDDLHVLLCTRQDLATCERVNLAYDPATDVYSLVE